MTIELVTFSMRHAFLFICIFASLALASAETVLHRGNLAESGTLDPAKQTLVGEYEIMSDLFMGLVQNSAEGLPIPGAAESWTVSATAARRRSSCATSSCGQTASR